MSDHENATETIWVGPGSPWANPFERKHRAHVALIEAQWRDDIIVPRSKLNRLWAASVMYRAWLNGGGNRLPAAVEEALAFAGAPPSIEQIRAALRGKTLETHPTDPRFCHSRILTAVAESSDPQFYLRFSIGAPDRRLRDRAAQARHLERLHRTSTRAWSRFGV